jgi:uncharacterized membrane protein
MAEKLTFTIRRAFLVPLGLLLVVLIVLLAVCAAQGEAAGRMVLRGGLVLLVAGLFVENLFRRLEVDETAVRVRRWFRHQVLRYSDLTAVEAVALRRRVFVTLWQDERFLLISNAYGGFAGLLAALLRRVPREVVAEEAVRLAEDPPRHNGPVVVCWLAVLFSLLILYRQLTAGG